MIGGRRLSREFGELRRLQAPHGRLARLSGSVARLGAMLAVLMHARVFLALGLAGAAGRDTRLELRPRHRRVGTAGPGDQPAGRAADVGAIEAETDALDQLAQHVRLLVQAGVCACRAGRFAVETGLQAFLEALMRLLWMSAENLCCMFHEVVFLFYVNGA